MSSGSDQGGECPTLSSTLQQRRVAVRRARQARARRPYGTVGQQASADTNVVENKRVATSSLMPLTPATHLPRMRRAIKSTTATRHANPETTLRLLLFRCLSVMLALNE